MDDNSADHRHGYAGGASAQDRREFLKAAAAIPAVLGSTQLLGVSTHMPDVVDAVESKGWDVDYFQTCVCDRYSDQAGQNAALARRFGSRS